MTQREMAEAVGVFMDRKWCGHPTCDGTCLPDYADSLDAMRAVEDEIERRGLCMAYRWYLSEAVKARAIGLWNGLPEEEFCCSIEYALATATAAERLEVMEEERHA